MTKSVDAVPFEKAVLIVVFIMAALSASAQQG